MYRIAVLFAGQLRDLDFTGWNHAWLFKDSEKTGIQVDVFVYSWQEDQSLIETPHINVVDIAQDSVFLDRKEFQNSVKSLENFFLIQHLPQIDEFIDIQYSQYWCVHHFAKQDLSGYDAVFKTRTDCIPTREPLDSDIKRILNSLTAIQSENHYHSDKWTFTGGYWATENHGRVNDHNLLFSIEKFKQFETLDFLDQSLKRWHYTYRADHNWFDILKTDIVYFDDAFRSPLAKDKVPSWPDRRKLRDHS